MVVVPLTLCDRFRFDFAATTLPTHIRPAYRCSLGSRTLTAARPAPVKRDEDADLITRLNSEIAALEIEKLNLRRSRSLKTKLKLYIRKIIDVGSRKRL